MQQKDWKMYGVKYINTYAKAPSKIVAWAMFRSYAKENGGKIPNYDEIYEVIVGKEENN